MNVGVIKQGMAISRFWRGCAVVLLVAFASAVRAEDESSAPGKLPRAILAAMEQTAPIFSQDGAVAVQASPRVTSYRMAVLSFADTCRRDVLRVVRQNAFAVVHPTLIVLGDATNDTRVLVTRHAEDDVTYFRVEMPDPEHADLDALRTALTGALLNEWLHALAPTNVASAPPAWLAGGLARYTLRQYRSEDFDKVLEQWSRGRLPPVQELLNFETVVAAQHPAVPSVLVAWLVEHSGNPVENLMKRLAAGQAWTPELVGEALRGGKDLTALAQEWDAWLTSQARAIHEPGTTRPGVVRAFRAQLLLYPADSDISIEDGWRGRTFEECLALPDSLALRKALTKQALQIRMFATGHDGTLQRVASEYADFLGAFSQNTAREKLRPLLAKAEDDRKKMEQRADKGETLRELPVDFHKEHR